MGNCNTWVTWVHVLAVGWRAQFSFMWPFILQGVSTMQALWQDSWDFFTCLREKETERQCVHPRQKPQSSYNLISEVTLHHFCYSLLTRSKLLNPTQTPWRVLQENVNTRKWKSLGASVYTFQKLKLEIQTASCMSVFKTAQQPKGKSPGVHQQKNGHTKCGIFIQLNTTPPKKRMKCYNMHEL